MSRKSLFTKEEILKYALDLTREKGFEAVTARALGAKLGTSHRPIFGYFKNMLDLQNAIIDASYNLFLSYIDEDIAKEEYPPYKASGMAYIRFARNEKKLFKLLFMRDRNKNDKNQLPREMDMIIDIICKQVNITRERARIFYIEMWACVHGLATMIATQYNDWSEEFCSLMLTDLYQGLKYKYENQQS